MKKIFSVLLSITMLSACANPPQHDTNIREYYNEISELSIIAEIKAKLTTREMPYTLAYTYKKDMPDIGLILNPPEISNISFSVSDTLKFDDTILEMAMPDKLGQTPADMIFGIIENIKTNVPKSTQINQDSISLTYEDEEILTNISLNLENYSFLSAEIFRDGKQILEAKFQT